MECAFVSSVCYNKISQTRWLKLQTFISHNLEVGNSKIKTLTSLMSDETDLLGLQMTAFYMVPESCFCFFSSSKDTNHIMGALSSYLI